MDGGMMDCRSLASLALSSRLGRDITRRLTLEHNIYARILQMYTGRGEEETEEEEEEPNANHAAMMDSTKQTAKDLAIQAETLKTIHVDDDISEDTTSSQHPDTIQGAASCLLDEKHGTIAVFGGVGNYNRQPNDQLWVFANSTWTRVMQSEGADWPEPCSEADLVALRVNPNRVVLLLYGGLHGRGARVDDTWIMELDVQNNQVVIPARASWTCLYMEMEDAPCARFHHASCKVTLDEDKREVWLLHGGQDWRMKPLGDLWVFDAVKMEWTELIEDPEDSPWVVGSLDDERDPHENPDMLEGWIYGHPRRYGSCWHPSCASGAYAFFGVTSPKKFDVDSNGARIDHCRIYDLSTAIEYGMAFHLLVVRLKLLDDDSVGAETTFADMPATMRNPGCIVRCAMCCRRTTSGQFRVYLHGGCEANHLAFPEDIFGAPASGANIWMANVRVHRTDMYEGKLFADVTWTASQKEFCASRCDAQMAILWPNAHDGGVLCVFGGNRGVVRRRFGEGDEEFLSVDAMACQRLSAMENATSANAKVQLTPPCMPLACNVSLLAAPHEGAIYAVGCAGRETFRVRRMRLL
ncbi:hypothetical protein RI054_10g52370 [Pseudoscourfieldia marina]